MYNKSNDYDNKINDLVDAAIDFHLHIIYKYKKNNPLGFQMLLSDFSPSNLEKKTKELLEKEKQTDE